MNRKFLDSASWRKKLYGHLALARISNTPTVVSNTLTGAALTGGILPAGAVCLVALAMGMFYTAGMYLNDVLDYPLDCRERPERPLPAGLVSLPTARVVVLMLFLTGALLLATIGPLPLLSGLILIALITCYNRWHKDNPLSPLLMALCRCMVYVTAFLACSWQLSSGLLLIVSLLGCYVMGLTSLAKAANRASRVSIVIIAILLLPALYFMNHLSYLILPLFLLFLAWMGYSLSLLYRPKSAPGKAIGQLIAGISLLDALVLVTTANLAGTMLALMAFVLTLFLQRYITGT